MTCAPINAQPSRIRPNPRPDLVVIAAHGEPTSLCLAQPRRPFAVPSHRLNFSRLSFSELRSGWSFCGAPLKLPRIMNSSEPKDALRRQIRVRLKSLPAEQRAALSALACSLLERQAVWQKAKTIFFYAPLPDELDIWPLFQDSLAAGKTVALPRFDEATRRYVACQIQDIGKDLGNGRFGIREPESRCIAVPLNRLDLILVPGVAFDLHGGRLGRGKGFYDQLLASVRGATCGVAFDEQIVEAVPVEAHDVHLNCILTPTRWIEP